MYPFLLPSRVDQPYIDHIKDVVGDQWENFIVNAAGPARRFYMFDDDDPLKGQLAGEFGITQWKPDPFFRNFIGYQTEGGWVHPHTDPSLSGCAHARINIMVSLPQAGGIPVLDGHPVPVQVGDVWLNLASICTHSSTAVVGGVPRIVLSLGMQVAIAQAEPLHRAYYDWQKSA